MPVSISESAYAHRAVLYVIKYDYYYLIVIYIYIYINLSRNVK